MGFEDEDILKARKDLKKLEEKEEVKDLAAKENEEDIADGMVHVYGEEVKFSQRDIPELKVRVSMPASAEPLSEEMKELFYPMGNRPSHIFASEEVHFTVGMNHSSNPLSNAHIKDFLPMSQKILERLGPKVKIVGNHYYPDETYNKGTIKFYSNAVDCVVENMMGFISLDERLFMITVSFPRKYEKRYETIGEQIIKSLEVIEEE